MFGLVQHHQLLLHTTLAHAAETYGDTEVVSFSGDLEARTTYAATYARTLRLASALDGLGIGKGDMAGALAWTTHRYFELFHGVPGVGAVLHTANPRLPARQLAAAVNQCGYRVLFVDADTIPLAEEILPLAPGLETFVAMAREADLPANDLPNLTLYDDLVAAGTEDFDWPDLDERSASTLCFTSGTTGEPKGALYSHRGVLLNVMAEAGPNALGFSSDDTALAISPFFHCNGWGLPYLAPMTGAKLVLPGRDLSSANLQRLIAREGVTFAGGVPTIWLDMIKHCRAHGLDLRPLQRILSGGSAPSPQLIATLFEEFGVRTVHAWGMTETTHGVTFTRPLPDGEPPPPAGGYAQGRPLFGARIRAADAGGRALAKGAPTPGRLQARGHWMATEYFKRPDVALSTADGWMETGDIGQVTDRNEMRITDRDKDVIKSGGEWISSQDLENAAAEIAGVAAAAVIGVAHPRWVERPLALAVLEAEATVGEDEILARLAARFPKWWIPDAVRFVEALPLTAVGKVDKRALKAKWQGVFSEEDA